jgi:hypothetical protein
MRRFIPILLASAACGGAPFTLSADPGEVQQYDTEGEAGSEAQGTDRASGDGAAVDGVAVDGGAMVDGPGAVDGPTADGPSTAADGAMGDADGDSSAPGESDALLDVMADAINDVTEASEGDAQACPLECRFLDDGAYYVSGQYTCSGTCSMGSDCAVTNSVYKTTFAGTLECE